MIDNDAAVAHNFQRLAGKGLQDLYADGDGGNDIRQVSRRKHRRHPKSNAQGVS